MRAWLVAVAILTSCAFEAAPPEVPEECGFPDDTAIAYAGRSSLYVLRIGSLDPRPGYVVVTADPIPPPSPASRRLPGEDVARYACVIWRSGSSVQMVRDTWEPAP